MHAFGFLVFPTGCDPLLRAAAAAAALGVVPAGYRGSAAADGGHGADAVPGLEGQVWRLPAHEDREDGVHSCAGDIHPAKGTVRRNHSAGKSFQS